MLGSYELSLPKIKIVMRLSELGTGEKGVIVKVLGHGGFRKRIVEMGFIKGKTVEVLLNAPLKDPIKYKVLGYEISLRRQEAEMIEVVSEEEAKKQGCDYHILYGNDTNEQALEFLKKNTGEKPVFLCTGEMFAIPMQKFLKKNGYRAPKDYGLMTYDRLMYRFWNEEAIAAVDNHVDQIGTSVANAVIDLIEEKEIPMNIEVPYDLEEGTSL